MSTDEYSQTWVPKFVTLPDRQCLQSAQKSFAKTEGVLSSIKHRRTL
jgi:hypothetical protein